MLDETQRNQVERSCQDSKNLSTECWSLMMLARQKLRLGACNKWCPGKHSGLQLRPQKSYVSQLRTNRSRKSCIESKWSCHILSICRKIYSLPISSLARAGWGHMELSPTTCWAHTREVGTPWVLPPTSSPPRSTPTLRSLTLALWHIWYPR